MKGLLEAIAVAATNDEQISHGKALSELEEAVLQALEQMTCRQDGIICFKAAMLREKVARLTGQAVEKMGNAPRSGHILKRLHLLDEARRKRGLDGITYAVKSGDVIDVMESFFATLKSECATTTFPSRTAARTASFALIEVYGNRQRLHSALGYLSPEQFEHRFDLTFL